MIDMIGGMIGAGQSLNFIQAMRPRQVDGERNRRDGRRQREHVKCGEREAYLPPPAFARDRQHFSFLPVPPATLTANQIPGKIQLFEASDKGSGRA